MSRFLLVCSLVASLTSSALAREAPRFAEAPRDDISISHDEEYLTVNRAQVRAKLVANRKANLERFRAYQKKGVFPSNTYRDGKLNVWIDAQGNLCAAATIIDASGMSELVRKVAEQNNFIRLADVQQGPLMDWILTSGLTQAEIAAIQEPFEVVTPEPMAEPPAPILVDAKLRAQEDARLRKRYKQVEAAIVKNAQRSLDQAVDRLMANPMLAQRFVNS